TAGALLGALGLVGIYSVQAQEGNRSERVASRIIRRPSRPTAQPGTYESQSPYGIRQVQEEVPPPPPFSAAEKEVAPEEPTAPQQPQFNAAEKEVPPEE